MKILPNIPMALTLLKDVRHYKKYAKLIDAARARGDFEEERRLILECTSTFGKLILDQVGCDLHVQGRENIPDKGPIVIMANHQSYADIPVCFAVFDKFQFGFIAKQYLAKMPLCGPWMPRIRSVFIENDDPREALKAINKGIEYIEDGFSMAICPEGTRSKGPEMGPFMRGAVKLATKPKVPIVPVSINGTYRMFEETGVVTPTRIGVIVHEPIETEGLTRQEERGLGTRIEQIIKDGVEKLVAEEQASA